MTFNGRDGHGSQASQAMLDKENVFSVIFSLCLVLNFFCIWSSDFCVQAKTNRYRRDNNGEDGNEGDGEDEGDGEGEGDGDGEGEGDILEYVDDPPAVPFELLNGICSCPVGAES